MRWKTTRKPGRVGWPAFRRQRLAFDSGVAKERASERADAFRAGVDNALSAVAERLRNRQGFWMESVHKVCGL